MAINVSQSFHRTSANPIDETLALTKAEMLSVNDNLMPSKYLSVCQDDGKIYLYDKSNTADPTTGKFRVFEGGGGGGTSDYSDLTNKPSINSVELSGNKTASDLGLAPSTDVAKAYKSDDATFTAIADGDYIPMYDISASEAKKSTWSNIKSVLKTYFDTLYNKITAGTGLSLSNNSMSIKQFASGDMDEVISELPSVGARYHQYSTEEQVVDRWIDGREVYEKVIQKNIVSTSSVSQTFLDVGANVNEYIFVDGYATLSTKSTIRITPYLSSNLSTFCQILAITNSASSNANKIRIDCTMTSLNGLKATVIVRYTKV